VHDINKGFLKKADDVFLSLVNQKACANKRKQMKIKSCGSPPRIEKQINRIVKKK
jgi:hypothetical protein